MKLRVRRGASAEFSFIDLTASAKIHIMGICGTAMSALAGLLQQKGYQISGSDRHFYPPISNELKRLKIAYLEGYKAEHIHPDLDLIVVGNVITKTLPETQALLDSGLPYVSLPEILNPLIIGNKKSVMVSGTHGKTTVASLIAWVLDQCGLDPSFLIGGVTENFQTNFRMRNSDWFVIEGDEYDTAFFEKTPKFVHYRATHTILTNIEFDHADIYKDIEEVKKAFILLMESLPPSSHLVACLSSPYVEEVIAHTRSSCVSYGSSRGDYQILRRKSLQTQMTGGQIVWLRGPRLGAIRIQTPLSGEHNALNILSVWTLGRILDLDPKRVISALKTFQGVRQRFQLLGNFNDLILIEDFAHHPTAVWFTLQSAREIYPEHRLLAIFEPRSNISRRNVFQTEYRRVLSVADMVFCIKPHDVSGIPEAERFSSEKLIQELNQSGTVSFYAEDVKSMAQLVQQKASKGDVVLVMSNGDFGGLCSLLKEGWAK